MPTVVLAEAAAFEVRDMLENSDMSDGYLKTKVSDRGCTGLTYDMSAEAEPGKNDEILGYYGLKILVDRNDVPVLNGTAIDFRQSLMDERFRMNNPSAIASCGCRSSFKTAKVAGNPEQC